VRGAEADRQPVPGVDRADHQGELHLLLIGELGLDRLIVGVRRVGIGDPGQRLGPAERGALSIAV